MDVISISTHKKVEFVDITYKIQEIIKKHKIKNGIIFLFVPHTTAGLTVNENADPDVKRDIIYKINDVFPDDKNFLHAEGNSDAHIKSSIIGMQLFFFIEEERLILGRWQGIYFCEFDGPRKREIYYKILKD